MADLNGIKIQKGQQGPSVLGVGDSISGLIIEAVAANSLALNVPAVIYNPKDAEALGIDQDFDDTNGIVAYRHILEFYRIVGEGTELHLMLIARNTGHVAVFAAVGTAPSRVLAEAADGTIRQLAVALNPTVLATLFLNQITADCWNGIPLAQGFAEWAFENHMPNQVVMEAREYQGTAASAGDLRDIPNVAATKVSLCIGQDYNYAHALAAVQQEFADVGTMLGTIAAADINQNIGENETFNLTDSTRSAWLVPGLSNHVKNKDQVTDLQTLEDKGYVFGLEYTGLAGVRWNNDHVCAPIIIDAEGRINEHTIAYGRTLDKSARLLRTAYLPKVKTTQPVNPETGKLPTGVVKYFDGIGDTVLGDMVKNGEITAGITFTDPESDLLVEKVLKVKWDIVPYGSIGSIEGTLNLNQSI